MNEQVLKGRANAPLAYSRTRRGGRRRNDIIRHARKLFSAKGFQQTTVDDIAGEVGIKREGVYYYFRNTSEILLEVVRPNMEFLNSSTRRVLDSNLHPESKFFLFIYIHLINLDSPTFFSLGLNPTNGSESELAYIHRELRPYRKRYEEFWMKLIGEARDNGAFRDTGDIKLTVYAILGMCNWLSRWFDPSRNGDIGRVADVFVSLAGFGLFTGETSAQTREMSPERLAEISAFIIEHPDAVVFDRTGDGTG